MDDRELLEMAAKAFGIAIDRWHEDANGVPIIIYVNDRGGHSFWQPLLENTLTDCMGDALRLAVSLGFVVDCSQPSASLPFVRHAFARAEIGSDPHSATRRAIVTAAAGVGRAMP